MIFQLRLWDAKRLTAKMGTLPSDQFEEIRKVIVETVVK